MPGADDLDEPCLGVCDIGKGLPWAWRVTEGDEVGGMAGSQAFADDRVLFETADPRAVTAAGGSMMITGCFFAVDLLPRAAENSQQRIVDRTRQVFTSDQRFMIELEQQWIPGAFVGQGIVAALTQGVPEQHAALAKVSEVFLPVSRCRQSELPKA